MRNDKQNVIVEKSVEFSLAVIKFTEVLEQERKYVIANSYCVQEPRLVQTSSRLRMQKAGQTSFIK